MAKQSACIALLDSGAACNECHSGYAGVHGDRCSKSTAKRCVLCFRPYHVGGVVCVLCTRAFRSHFEQYCSTPE